MLKVQNTSQIGVGMSCGNNHAVLSELTCSENLQAKHKKRIRGKISTKSKIKTKDRIFL